MYHPEGEAGAARAAKAKNAVQILFHRNVHAGRRRRKGAGHAPLVSTLSAGQIDRSRKAGAARGTRGFSIWYRGERPRDAPVVLPMIERTGIGGVSRMTFRPNRTTTPVASRFDGPSSSGPAGDVADGRLRRSRAH